MLTRLPILRHDSRYLGFKCECSYTIAGDGQVVTAEFTLLEDLNLFEVEISTNGIFCKPDDNI